MCWGNTQKKKKKERKAHALESVRSGNGWCSNCRCYELLLISGDDIVLVPCSSGNGNRQRRRDNMEEIAGILLSDSNRNSFSSFILNRNVFEKSSTLIVDAMEPAVRRPLIPEERLVLHSYPLLYSYTRIYTCHPQII